MCTEVYVGAQQCSGFTLVLTGIDVVECNHHQGDAHRKKSVEDSGCLRDRGKLWYGHSVNSCPQEEQCQCLHIVVLSQETQEV